MNCLYCHQPVENLGPTFPRTVHLECVADAYEELEDVTRKVDLPPPGTLMTWPRYANLKQAERPR